jgi:hypothetical protein
MLCMPAPVSGMLCWCALAALAHEGPAALLLLMLLLLLLFLFIHGEMPQTITLDIIDCVSTLALLL